MIARVIAGYVALALSLTGHALIASGRPIGWRLRSASGPLWVWCALANGVAPYIASAFIYLALDIYGAVARKR